MLSFFLLGLLVPLALGEAAPEFLEYAARHPNTDVYNPEYGELWEGDIIIPEGNKGQFWLMNPFNGVVDRSLLWPDNILYYSIRASDFTTTEIGLINEGIVDLVDSVNYEGECITLVERTTESNYVEVYKGSGCSSSIGMVGGRQLLSLAASCVTRHGTIMHEFLHALGFHHEQKRGDRDDFITVNWENIQSGYEHNFVKLTEGVDIDHLGTPYDYGSVMHYGAYGFAIDPSIPTIIPHDPDAEIGQRTHLSEMDIERVRVLYGCTPVELSKFFNHLAKKTF